MPTTEKLKRRPAIKDSFKILVVPQGDITTRPNLSIPMVMEPQYQNFRVVAQAYCGDVEACPWAFSKKTHTAVVRDLRRLANFLAAGRKILEAPKRRKKVSREKKMGDDLLDAGQVEPCKECGSGSTDCGH